jgi:glycosyltransferase involved in cell wall biosynthesis
MKLVFFTPVDKRSAIGRVTRLVVGELRGQGHHVDIVRTEWDQAGEVHDLGSAVISWRDDVAVVRAGLAADMCVYQVANHYPFHAGSLQWLDALPGVVCLHDQFVGHLFDGWVSVHGTDPDVVVRRWYGDEVAEIVARPDVTLEQRVQLAPMSEWVAARGLGVISHGEWTLDRLVAACPGPVRAVPLPYELPRVPIEPVVDPLGRFRLVTIGHMNTNKRVASVIEAIGSDPQLRDRVVYTLLGFITPTEGETLRSLAAQHGVELEVAGEVNEIALGNALANAHAVAALRWPCLEAASASAIEAMMAGKPTLVTRAGFYDELPDDCVFKIDLANEVADVRAALVTLVADPRVGAEVGERARLHAVATHTPQAYADQLVALAREALAVSLPLGVIRDIVATLQGWGGGGDVGDEYTFGPLRAMWGETAPAG